jgi:hypothetical protein
VMLIATKIRIGASTAIGIHSIRLAIQPNTPPRR